MIAIKNICIIFYFFVFNNTGLPINIIYSDVYDNNNKWKIPGKTFWNNKRHYNNLLENYYCLPIVFSKRSVIKLLTR